MTQVEIVNLSLKHLGLIGNLTDLSGSDPATKAANIYWAPCRDDILRKSRWAFATVQAQMSQIDLVADATETVKDWDYVYTYPASAVIVHTVFDSSAPDAKDSNDFEVKYSTGLSAKKVCCNINATYCEYTYPVTTTTQWDANFIMAFSYRLASYMAHDLTGDKELGVQMMNISNYLIGETQRLSHSEKRKVPEKKSHIIDARA